MNRQKNTRLYWKDALQQVKVKLDDEKTTARQHNKWARAFHQAEADLKDPSAVVWLPDEIVDVIRSHPIEEPPPVLTHRQRFGALLLALFILVPAAISYLLAYRRIAALR